MSSISLILLVIILIINYFIYKRYKYDKKLYLISLIFIIINFAFIYLIYRNNLSLGFENGIVFGDKLGLLATDEYKYFMESEHLVYNLKKYGGFKAYFNGELVTYPFKVDNKPYGIYNYFVFILAVLKCLGIKSLIELLTLKLIFMVFNTYLVYNISRKFLNEKFALIATIVFNMAPAYILINATLLRDNIIITAILMLILLIIEGKWNFKNIIILGVMALFLNILRVYTLIALIATFIFTFKKSNKIISKVDISFIILFILGLFLFDKISTNIDEIEYLQYNYHEYFGTGITGMIALLFQTIKNIFVRGLFLNTLPTKSIYVMLTVLGAVYYMLLVPLFIYKVIIILFIDRDETKVWLCKFTIYFTLLNALILMLKDIMIPTRLCIMWYLLHIIIILLPVKKNDFIPKRYRE
ncbi:MAG: hypothetical protein E7F58_12740 [Clostridium saudiense]|uniref:hypothetical protein n=1 Tax=Clostridium saudiense TaxID=1414720 RepID=UPI0029078747|nr:hypothetical protein [Clostridium saudiense]MDU3522506.1 hypothetical protein [Clostridium saudiense]